MNLLKALATVSSFTLVSRILGFVRDSVIARSFGAGLATDAFFVAFRIPNLLRRLFAEGAFSQAFVPILAEYRNRRGDAETHALLDHVTGALMLVLVIVTAVGMVAAPLIIWVSAPGFTADPGKFGLTVALLRVTFPYILFISLTALAAGLLNTWGRFSVPAATPVLLNLTFIVFALWLAPYFDPPVMALGWAVFVGGALQLAFQIPFLLRLRLLPRPRFSLAHEGMRRVLRQMGPAVLGVSVGQVSLLINTIFASFLVTGSVSWLYYADRLMEFPTGLLGAALGTILLPSLSKTFADQAHDEYSRLLDWGLRLTILLAVPAAAALAVLAVPLIATLFHYGAFSAEDVRQTRSALVCYSAGLVGLILVRVLAPGFYAQQNIRTPVKIGIMTLIATQFMNLIFVWPLAHAGLALAISLGACMNATLLYRGLRSRGIFQPQAGWGRFFAQVGAATLLMALTLAFTAGAGDWWMHAGVGPRVGRLAGVVAAGSAVYFAVLWLAGVRPRHFIKRGAE
jgi:putative peptidoglycan lipid II flippase